MLDNLDLILIKSLLEQNVGELKKSNFSNDKTLLDFSNRTLDKVKQLIIKQS